MKSLITATLSLVCLFCFTHGFAQDLIVKNDGSKIYCKIIEVDSASIFYFRAAQKNKSVISRTEVKVYYTSKALNKSGKVVTDSFPQRNELFIVKFGGGFANPLGVFASKDLELETAGLANTGLLLNASLILKLSKHFGFIGSFRYQKNTVDNTILQQSYNALNPPGVFFNVSSTHWLSQGFFGGLFFDAPVNSEKNLSINFTFLGGLPKFKSPEINIIVNNYGSKTSIMQNAGKTSGPAFEAKMGLKYKFERIALSFEAGYFTAKPTFYSVLVKSSNGNSNYFKFQQKISSFNVEVGLSYLIFR